MSTTINILDSEYSHWLKDLCKRYRRSRIKAAVAVMIQCLNSIVAWEEISSYSKQKAVGEVNSWRIRAGI